MCRHCMRMPAQRLRQWWTPPQPPRCAGQYACASPRSACLLQVQIIQSTELCFQSSGDFCPARTGRESIWAQACPADEPYAVSWRPFHASRIFDLECVPSAAKCNASRLHRAAQTPSTVLTTKSVCLPAFGPCRLIGAAIGSLYVLDSVVASFCSFQQMEPFSMKEGNESLVTSSGSPHTVRMCGLH